MQDGNDSNYSFSELLSDTDYLDSKELAKREAEKQALSQLDKAQVGHVVLFVLATIIKVHVFGQKSKPVAFAVRTNVSFEASYDDNPPVTGYAISFGIREFIHIKEVCNHCPLRRRANGTIFAEVQQRLVDWSNRKGGQRNRLHSQSGQVRGNTLTAAVSAIDKQKSNLRLSPI